MNRTSILVLAMWFAGSRSAARPAGHNNTLLIVVYDHAGTPRETLSIALLRARQIFSKAGVASNWTMATPSTELPLRALSIHIVAKHNISPQMEALGTAVINTDGTPPSAAFAYWEAIREHATDRIDEPTLLGHVMAHEVGHLLLGATHTPYTVMAPRWASRDYVLMKAGYMNFSRQQAKVLRSVLAAR